MAQNVNLEALNEIEDDQDLDNNFRYLFELSISGIFEVVSIQEKNLYDNADQLIEERFNGELLDADLDKKPSGVYGYILMENAKPGGPYWSQTGESTPDGIPEGVETVADYGQNLADKLATSFPRNVSVEYLRTYDGNDFEKIPVKGEAVPGVPNTPDWVKAVGIMVAASALIYAIK